MIRLLYYLFPSAFHRAVFMSQYKPKGFDSLELAFVDSEGRKYYKYMSDFELSIKRLGAFEMKFKELQMCLSADELTGIIEAMDTALKAKDKRGHMSPDIGMIGHLINEIRNRKENLVHTDIMLEMVSYLYVREDEDPEIVDDDIHSQKVKQFTKDSETRLRDFFLAAGLNKYVPYLEQSGYDWDQIFSYQKARIEALKDQLQNYSTAGQ